MRDLNCDNNRLIMTIRTVCVNGDTDFDRSRYIVAPVWGSRSRYLSASRGCIYKDPMPVSVRKNERWVSRGGPSLEQGSLEERRRSTAVRPVDTRLDTVQAADSR